MKDEEFYKNLGVVLRAEREKRNLSQQEIADKLGVSKMLVSNWESGQRRMYAPETYVRSYTKKILRDL